MDVSDHNHNIMTQSTKRDFTTVRLHYVLVVEVEGLFHHRDRAMNHPTIVFIFACIRTTRTSTTAIVVIVEILEVVIVAAVPHIVVLLPSGVCRNLSVS